MQIDDRLGDDADTFYAKLLEAHKDLDAAQSHALNARLVLMLANEVGDIKQLSEILRAARLLTKR
ncbi:MAG: DUF2783 domain-containing protein [Roseobacter sp.]